MRAYFAIMKIAMKSILNNKSSVAILLLQSLVPIIVMGYLWSSILAPGQKIGGMSKNQMLVYYCGVNFINFFVWYAIDWDLNNDIHSGELSNILHRPVALQTYYFCRMLGDRAANFLLLAPLVLLGLVYLCMHSGLAVSVITIVKFLVNIALTATLWFMFSYLVGCLAYWFENLFFVLLVKEVMVSLLAGYYFPLAILPSAWRRVLNWLPFQYFGAFPVTSLIKKTSTVFWLQNVALEVIWLGIFYVLMMVANKRGLHQYSDVRG
ncbi:ABC transporter permease [Lactobacillus xylocopicola]|uniref:ABC transporter permease n=1 Tax=Lactobacillus xylocopicola TaxID=2976676 RepID=A0ABM8BGH7_9LACO|nr:ABC transporter permease [Lactobacillus xylocopicola]BDR60354.1 hypothetical protein KIM322_06150 [Lactobacillus xylocopicola]